MITIESSGSFSKTEKFLGQMSTGSLFADLKRYGQMGVDALAIATPIESGLTSSSWTYTIGNKKGNHSITWHNTNIDSGVPVAILLQYGHGTGTGGWVEGRDYINPTIRPLFDKIAADVWEQVTHG